VLVEFRILGPVEVSNGAGVLRLGGPKQRALLADLVLNAGTAVSTAQLIGDLWGNDPPPTAEHTVEAYISRIRRILRDDSAREVLLTKPPGYLLDVGRDHVDAFRFEQLVEEGTAAAGRGDDNRASAALHGALGLWHGDALADVCGAPFARGAARQLADRRLLALQRRIEFDLRLGRAQDLIAELQELAAAYPYHEPFREQLMLALYQSGRQTEALAEFRRARVLLVDELGIEPGPELRKLEQAILRQDPELQGHPMADPRIHGRGRSPPRTLPGPGPPPRRAPRRGRALVAAGLALAVAATGGLVALRHSATGALVPPSDVRANAVVFVDPARTAVLGQAGTRGRPTGIAAGFGRLWVTDAANGRVLVLDPATFRIEDQIPVGRDPAGVAATANGIWVTDPGSGTVSEINPRSQTVVATVAVAAVPSAISVGAGGIWVADASNGALTRIDPDRASVVDAIDVGQPLTDVAVGLGSVWVTSASSGQLIEIDPRAGRVTETVAIGNGPASVRVVDGAVWVANPPDDTLSRFEPATGLVRKLTVSDPTGLAGAAGALWVASDAPAALTRVDPATGTITSSTALANPPAAMVGAGRTLALVTHAAPATHRGGTLSVVAGGGVDSIDPGVAWSASDWQLLSMTNDGLLTYARSSYPGSAALVPDLATTLPLVQDGGRTFTFRLRRGVRYSNGIAVRPEDFRRALEREYQAGTGLAALGVHVAGSQRCGPRHVHCRLDSGVTVDDASRTVTYHLSAPDPAFLDQLALPFGAAVPSGTAGIGPGTPPLPATGPYHIASYSPGRQVLLVRNPAFAPGLRPRSRPASRHGSPSASASSPGRRRPRSRPAARTSCSTPRQPERSQVSAAACRSRCTPTRWARPTRCSSTRASPRSTGSPPGGRWTSQSIARGLPGSRAGPSWHGRPARSSRRSSPATTPTARRRSTLARPASGAEQRSPGPAR
jgi:YVTN family beta-propeller protein